MSESLELRLRSAADIISSEYRFVLATHVLPDGDAIGSLLGLAFFLKSMSKNARVAWSEETKVPPQYGFLPGTDLLRPTPGNAFGSDQFVLVVLDCSSADRLGSLEPLTSSAKQVINIDHHPGNSNFGSVNLVDETAPAACELVFRVSRVLQKPLNKDIAMCLYTGLVTDTGRFQYSNAGPRAFEMAQDLLRYDLSPVEIFERVYENLSFSNLKLLGQVLDKAELVPRLGLIYSRITQENLREAGAQMEETENFIDLLRSARETRVAAIIKEMPDGSLKVSLRSKDDINVGEVARKCGGGGHSRAAGYTSSHGFNATVRGLIEVLEREKNVVKR